MVIDLQVKGEGGRGGGGGAVRPFSLLPVSLVFCLCLLVLRGCIVTSTLSPSFLYCWRGERWEEKRAQGEGFMREKGETIYDLLPRERKKRKEVETKRENAGGKIDACVWKKGEGKAIGGMHSPRW